MAGGQVQQFRERPGRRLAAVGHGRAVEAAERAMHPLAPPAPARSLDEHARLPVTAEAAPMELREEVGEVRIRQGVEVHDALGGRRRNHRGGCIDRVPGHHALQRPNRFTGDDAGGQLGENLIGLAGDDGVNVGELANGLHPHRRLAVGAAHDDITVWEPLFQPSGKRQRGEVLLEDAGEADQPRSRLDDLIRAGVDETGRGVASLQDRPQFARRRRPGRVAAQPRRRFQEHFGDVALVVRCGPVEQRVREDPLADECPRHRAVLAGDLRIEFFADRLGEGQGEIVLAAGHSARRDQRLQQAEPERR